MTLWRFSPVSYPQWLDIHDLLCVTWTHSNLREGETRAGCLLYASCWASQPRVAFLNTTVAEKQLLRVFIQFYLECSFSQMSVWFLSVLHHTLSDVCHLLKEVWSNWLFRNNSFHSCHSVAFFVLSWPSLGDDTLYHFFHFLLGSLVEHMLYEDRDTVLFSANLLSYSMFGTAEVLSK